MRILVVDDDIELGQVIVDTLEDHGYESVSVQSAEEALQKIMANPPDAILLDLEVPIMGGFVLCQKLRANPQTRNIPVIFLTVRDSDIDKQTAMSLGANQYITKPFRRSHLLEEVDSVIANSQAGEELIGPSQAHTQRITPPPSQSPPPQPQQPPQPQKPPQPQQPPRAPQPPRSPQPPQRSVVPPQKKEVRPPSRTTKKDGDDRVVVQGYVEASATAGAARPGTADMKTFESFRGTGGPMTERTGNWIRENKAIALGIGSVLILSMMWSSVTLYRKYSLLNKKIEEQVPAGSGVVAVNVMEIMPAPFQDILSAVGTVAGGSEIELRFQTEGNLKTLNFHEGDAVRKGQVIATVDQTQVRIKLGRARSEFYRYEKLFALGGVSKDRLEEAKVQYDFAKSELSKTVLKATQDGIFGDKGVEVGEFITPQKKVGTLVNLDTVLIRIGVIEKEIDKIYPGQTVMATVDTYPGVDFKGQIENISPLVQGQSKTLTIEARLPNDGKLLLPGMFARTRIVVHEVENAISVPNDALEKTPQGYQIYVAGKDGKAEVRPLEISYVSLTHSVVSKGLEPGEQVIVQRPQELKDGSQLKIVEVEKPIQGPY